jgi:hypothetical protein
LYGEKRTILPRQLAEGIARGSPVGSLTAASDAAMETPMRIVRIGDPFVPRGLEGVCIHVRATDGTDDRGREMRILIAERGGSPTTDAVMKRLRPWPTQRYSRI